MHFVERDLCNARTSSQTGGSVPAGCRCRGPKDLRTREPLGVSTGAEYGQVCVNVVSITRFHSRIRICGSHGMIHAKDCFEHVRSCEQLHYDHCEVPFTADTKPDFGDDPEPT